MPHHYYTFYTCLFPEGEAVNLSSIPDDYKALYQDDTGLPYFSEKWTRIITSG